MRLLPPILEEKLRDEAEQHGLLERFEEIRCHARLTFLMRVLPVDDPAEVPVGKSRLGGAHDLAADEVWARNREGKLFDFIMQIHLSDLPEVHPLPKNGMLYVFAQQENACANEHSIRLFSVPVEELSRTSAPAETDFADEDSAGPFGVLLVTEFVPSISLPDSLRSVDDEFHEAYSALRTKLSRLPAQKEPASRLLGYPTPWDSELGDERELLIQAESHFHSGKCYMNFWDAGCLQVLVRTSEIATCRFTTSEANVFSN